MNTSILSQASERLAVPAAEAAKLLDISERHFWALHASGKLGPLPIRLGRATRWRLSELQGWVEAGCPPRDRWLARDSNVIRNAR